MQSSKNKNKSRVEMRTRRKMRTVGRERDEFTTKRHARCGNPRERANNEP